MGDEGWLPCGRELRATRRTTDGVLSRVRRPRRLAWQSAAPILLAHVPSHRSRSVAGRALSCCGRPPARRATAWRQVVSPDW